MIGVHVNIVTSFSLQFSDTECAKKALDQLNGFELAGRPMKVGHVTERTDASNASSFLDNDELERTGIDLGTTGRLQLMARLAEGKARESPGPVFTKNSEESCKGWFIMYRMRICKERGRVMSCN
jgi:RNA recognition motif-containing protein